MILKTSGQILHSKLIEKPESEAQCQLRCYHATSINHYLKKKVKN
jgi:hypothetical protein